MNTSLVSLPSIPAEVSTTNPYVRPPSVLTPVAPPRLTIPANNQPILPPMPNSQRTLGPHPIPIDNIHIYSCRHVPKIQIPPYIGQTLIEPDPSDSPGPHFSEMIQSQRP